MRAYKRDFSKIAAFLAEHKQRLANVATDYASLSCVERVRLGQDSAFDALYADICGWLAASNDNFTTNRFRDAVYDPLTEQ